VIVTMAIHAEANAMVDQSRVTSGFDVEFLMTEEFIRYFLLCSLDTGSIPWASEASGTTGTPPVPYQTVTIIHPPHEIEDHRLYPVFSEFEGHEHAYLDLTPAYSTLPEELHVTILLNDARGADISVRVFPTVIDTLVTPAKIRVESVAIDLALGFKVVGTTRPDGLLGDIGIELKLLDVSGPLIDAIELLLSQPDPPTLPTRADILAQLKSTIDRTVPFAVSGGGALQRIETRTFAGDQARPAAIGAYINLALRNGPAPTEFLTAARGDVARAQNFLEPGMTMAFAFPPETFGLLSNDLMFKMAKPKPGNPAEYHYPLMDGDDQIGVIKGITVRPELAQPPSTPPVFTNALVIDIHGEYEVENWFDPDFHLRLALRPETGARGVFDFDIDIDLSLSATATLSALFVGLAISVFLPQLGIPLTILTVVAIKAAEHFGAEAAGSAIESEGGMTSFLDTLPHKLVVEQRRWDPLYTTDHRVETADVDLLVNSDGFAMAAKELFLGRRTRPLANMVIRTETRAADGMVDGLVYRASDLGPYLAADPSDLESIEAAVDRMPYVSLLPPVDIESHRVALTLEHVQDRIDAGDRHLADLDYSPAKVDVIAHQVFQILAVSSTETDEAPGIARSLLRSEYRAQHANALRQQAISELQTELGRTPTEAEIRARIDALVNVATEPAVPGRTRVELDRRLTFDLEPSEFAALQRTKILTLGRDQLEIRTTPDGTVYYRDYERPFEPNTPTSDNLLSLPRYKHTDV
jgi:hypothetical protein